ncbi:MAG: hypothetical protein ABI204_02050 [Ginsengibacter sp.]
MNTYKKIILATIIAGTIFSAAFTSCTKIQDGFISPYIQYAVNEFSFVRGRITSSYSLIPDGSNIPLHVTWTHIYDSTGKIVDDIFRKKYLVGIWTSAYDPLTDITYASIFAKRAVDSLPPILVNEANGTITTNSGSFNLPLGTYSMDLEVSNSAGKQELKNILKITITDGKALETAPEQGTFRNQLALVGNAAPSPIFNFSNNDNPFDDYSVTRFADTPNILVLKVMDRNGVPFSPLKGEITKRPNTGLNPIPPFLQNLQDYAPDTYIATDTAMIIKYPLTPFPIISLGNGFNMYYNILSTHISIDSTSDWSINTPGNFYKGPADPHYLGVYQNGRYNYYLRVPMRIQVPGAYEIAIKVLNITYR